MLARDEYLESRGSIPIAVEKKKYILILTVKFKSQNDLFILYLENCTVRIGNRT